MRGLLRRGAPDPFMPPPHPFHSLFFWAAGTSRPTCSPTSPTAASARPRCGSGAWTPSSTRPSRFFGSFQGLGFWGGGPADLAPSPCCAPLPSSPVQAGEEGPAGPDAEPVGVAPRQPGQESLPGRGGDRAGCLGLGQHAPRVVHPAAPGEPRIAPNPKSSPTAPHNPPPSPPQTPFAPDGLSSRGNLNLALKFIPAGSEGER